MRIQRRRVFARGVFGVLAAALAAGAATAAQGPPSTHTVAVAAYPVAVASGAYKIYDFVVDFPPGSETPRHVHGGPVVVTVISGQLVLERGGRARVVKAGESFLETPGDVHALSNRTAVPARISAAELIPEGAAETTIVK
jgi:quercetin dioxygenase-like cupin family protein